MGTLSEDQQRELGDMDGDGQGAAMHEGFTSRRLLAYPGHPT
jgi:hypothetical protein